MLDSTVSRRDLYLPQPQPCRRSSQRCKKCGKSAGVIVSAPLNSVVDVVIFENSHFGVNNRCHPGTVFYSGIQRLFKLLYFSFLELNATLSTSPVLASTSPTSRIATTVSVTTTLTQVTSVTSKALHTKRITTSSAASSTPSTESTTPSSNVTEVNSLRIHAVQPTNTNSSTTGGHTSTVQTVSPTVTGAQTNSALLYVYIGVGAGMLLIIAGVTVFIARRHCKLREDTGTTALSYEPASHNFRFFNPSKVASLRLSHGRQHCPAPNLPELEMSTWL